MLSGPTGSPHGRWSSGSPNASGTSTFPFMTLVAVNGIQLNISDSGAPTGKPDAPVLVMGHGLLFSTTMWRHQIEVLRADYRCIAIDWRGQGATPPTDGGYDMDTLFEDTAALI